MNRIQNDYGQWVASVGAPNSRERIKATYPKLIESLKVAFHEIPVSGVMAVDLIDRGLDRKIAKTISEIVRQECCSYCAKDGLKPSHYGSALCKSGSIASGGTKSHCSCDVCF